MPIQRPIVRANQLPFWSRREARLLVLLIVIGVSIAVVIYFEILPMLETAERTSETAVERPLAIPPWRGDPADARFNGLLAEVVDGVPLESLDAPYSGLLEFLTRMPPEKIAQEADLLPYAKYGPELRGRVAAITALVAGQKLIALERKVGDVEYVHRLTLVDLVDDVGYIVDLILPPPPIVEKKTVVTTNALFLRRVKYESQTGLMEAPLLLARTVTPIVEQQAEYEPSALDSRLPLIALTVMSLGLVAVLWWTHRGNQQRRLGELSAAQKRRPFVPPPPVARAQPRVGHATRTTTENAEDAAHAERMARLHAAEHQRLMKSDARFMAIKSVLSVGSILLIGYLLYTLYRKLSRDGLEPVSIPAVRSSGETAYSAAVIARAEIAKIQTELARLGAELSVETSAALRDRLRLRLAELEKSADDYHVVLEVLRVESQFGRTEPIDVMQVRRNYELKLWIADATDLLEYLAESRGVPGYYLRAAECLGESMRVRQDVDATLASASAEALSAQAPTLRAALERCGVCLRELEAYVLNGLARESISDEHLPELAQLRAEAAALAALRQRLGE
ncbi:MAG: hypothetical protein ACKVX7_20510 [Planctomycetota bacterium]